MMHKFDDNNGKCDLPQGLPISMFIHLSTLEWPIDLSLSISVSVRKLDKKLQVCIHYSPRPTHTFGRL
jgi:hypothetical protein